MEFADYRPIVIRGGGDIATGTIHRLFRCGFPVLVLEAPRPSAIRRYVAFSEAVYEGSWTVEQVEAVRVESLKEAFEQWNRGKVPVLVDPEADCVKELKPRVLVDGILAKKNLGTRIEMAHTVIALGPGFTAGADADLVIETQRGHRLGRILREGSAEPNTGIPGIIGGYGIERVIHAPDSGVIRCRAKIGELVEKGQIIAWIQDVPVYASIGGVLRGIIRDGYQVKRGLKIADVDPREEQRKNCFLISDKARCIAGGVLEGILEREYAGIFCRRS